MKFLLWALVIYLAWRWYETKKLKSSETGAAPAAADVGTGSGAEKMVACAQCGIHLPQSEAVRSGALHYCSDAHRLSHSRTTD